jgi:hypothetical protein
MMAGFLAVSFHSMVAVQLPPFPFGTAAGDVALPLDNFVIDAPQRLPIPMTYSGNVHVSFFRQATDGFVALTNGSNYIVGYVAPYATDIDTRNGGTDQNQIWMRAWNATDDLNLARDILAGNGTLFRPQAIIVATWYKVEANPQQAGPQNTFQLAIPYSERGETWAIYAYSQLEFFKGGISSLAFVQYQNDRDYIELFNTIDSNATMVSLLNGTNCNRTGVYVHRINAGAPTKAPTKAPTDPTKPPTKKPTSVPIRAPTMAPMPAPTFQKCGLLGWSIFCPITLCGIFGRWLGWCHSVF